MAKSFRLLREAMPAQSQQRIHKKVQESLSKLPLAEVRKARSLTQEQLAEKLAIKQASVSKMESQTDMYISTMRKYIEAMGGELEIIANFPDGSIQVERFETLKA